MKVHFYEVLNCTCDNVDDRPVLVAPESLSYDLMTYYQFVLLPDGRWVHFLTKEEYARVMRDYPNRDVTFRHNGKAEPPTPETPEEKVRGNILALISLGFLLLSYLLLFVFDGLNGFSDGLLNRLLDGHRDGIFELYFGSWFAAVFLFTGLPQCISILLLFLSRVKYPKNLLSKIMTIIIIVQIPLILVFLGISGCSACASFLSYSCRESMAGCPG